MYEPWDRIESVGAVGYVCYYNSWLDLSTLKLTLCCPYPSVYLFEHLVDTCIAVLWGGEILMFTN